MDYIKTLAALVLVGIAGGLIAHALSASPQPVNVSVTAPATTPEANTFGGTVNGAYTTIGDGIVGATHNLWNFTSGLTVGTSTTNRTTVKGLQFGSCSVQVSASTIAASSTKQVDCQAGTGGVQSALSGIVPGDTIWMSQSSTTVGNLGSLGLVVNGVNASTTPGYITMYLFNGTGATFTWSTVSSSSFKYFVLR